MLEAMTRNWGALAFRGLVAILFGIVAFAWPGLTIGVIVLLVAAFALVEGVINVVAGVRVREGWSIAEGVISVLFGAVVLVVGPAWTALALLYWLPPGRSSPASLGSWLPFSSGGRSITNGY